MRCEMATRSEIWKGRLDGWLLFILCFFISWMVLGDGIFAGIRGGGEILLAVGWLVVWLAFGWSAHPLTAGKKVLYAFLVIALTYCLYCGAFGAFLYLLRT